MASRLLSRRLGRFHPHKRVEEGLPEGSVSRYARAVPAAGLVVASQVGIALLDVRAVDDGLAALEADALGENIFLCRPKALPPRQFQETHKVASQRQRVKIVAVERQVWIHRGLVMEAFLRGGRPEELQGQFMAVPGLPEVDGNRDSLLVDPPHQRYLLFSLGSVALINAQGIGPKRPWVVIKTDISECVEEVYRYLVRLSLESDGSRVAGDTPCV